MIVVPKQMTNRKFTKHPVRIIENKSESARDGQTSDYHICIVELPPNCKTVSWSGKSNRWKSLRFIKDMLFRGIIV